MIRFQQLTLEELKKINAERDMKSKISNWIGDDLIHYCVIEESGSHEDNEYFCYQKENGHLSLYFACSDPYYSDKDIKVLYCPVCGYKSKKVVGED